MSEPSERHRWLVRHELGALLSQESESDIAAKDASFMRLIGALPPKPPGD